ncbi:MAG: ABC transporter permease [Prevotella sp.]|nr:ABC transporter permease [Prevotella sp.]
MRILSTIKTFLADILSTACAEARAIIRDEGVLLFVVALPLFYPILYSWIYNNEVTHEVPVAVVDASHSSTSREFVRMYDASPDVRVAYFCNSLDEARRLVASQDINGIVYLPEDMDTRLNRMQPATVSIYCDMSLMLAYKAIYSTATSVAGIMNSRIQIRLSGNATDREDQISTQPLKYEEVPMFNPTGGYGNFILPGVLALILQQTLLLGIGMLYATRNERRQPFAPACGTAVGHAFGWFRLMTGRTLCFLLLYSMLTAYVLLAIPKMFSFVQLLHPGDLVAFVLPYLLACMFMSMSLGAVLRQREDVMLVVVFTSVPLLFMSGVSWPQSNIPAFWRAAACLFPSTFGIQGFVKLNTMGAVITDIAPECKALWIQAGVYFCIAALLLRRMMRRHEG